MDEEFLINIVIAGKKYPLTIKRHEEELARAAADQINSKILQYRQHFAVSGLIGVKNSLRGMPPSKYVIRSTSIGNILLNPMWM